MSRSAVCPFFNIPHTAELNQTIANVFLSVHTLHTGKLGKVRAKAFVLLLFKVLESHPVLVDGKIIKEWIKNKIMKPFVCKCSCRQKCWACTLGKKWNLELSQPRRESSHQLENFNDWYYVITMEFLAFFVLFSMCFIIGLPNMVHSIHMAVLLLDQTQF